MKLIDCTKKVFLKYGSSFAESHRHNPLLVSVVEELGTDANGKYSDLKIVEIPVEYYESYTIKEYDGEESIDYNPIILI